MQRAKDTPLLFDNPVVKKVAEKHGKTPAQVLLRWATQRDVAVIPKSNNQGRLAQNLDVTGWDLEKGEVEAISGLDKGLRFNDPLNVSFFFLPLAEIVLSCVFMGMLMSVFSMAYRSQSMCRRREDS